MMGVNILILRVTLLSLGWGNNFLLETDYDITNNTEVVKEDGEDYEEDYYYDYEFQKGPSPHACEEIGNLSTFVFFFLKIFYFNSEEIWTTKLNGKQVDIVALQCKNPGKECYVRERSNVKKCKIENLQTKCVQVYTTFRWPTGPFEVPSGCKCIEIN